jgi:hypothetical protein
MAGTENNAAIAAALQGEESRKWNPFVKGTKGFNTQNDRIITANILLKDARYPLLKSFVKNPYEAGKFCKKFNYYQECRVLKEKLSGSSFKNNSRYGSKDKRSLYDLQTDAWKANYERGFTGTEETNARNGKNFTSKYGRTRSNRKRGSTRKRV